MRKLIILACFVLLSAGCQKYYVNYGYVAMPPPQLINDSLFDRRDALTFLFPTGVDIQRQDSLLVLTTVVDHVLPDSAGYRPSIDPYALKVFDVVFKDQRMNNTIMSKVIIRFVIFFWDDRLGRIAG